MLSQEIKREEDYEEHFAGSLLVPRRNQWILGRGSASLGAYTILSVKEKAIQQLLQNHLTAQIPAYTGAFAQLLFFNFSLKMKLKESKVKKTT